MENTYQAFVVIPSASFQIAAEPRLSRREAIQDADRMHADRDGKYRVVVIDNSHRWAGSQESVVYDLPADE